MKTSLWKIAFRNLKDLSLLLLTASYQVIPLLEEGGSDWESLFHFNSDYFSSEGLLCVVYVVQTGARFFFFFWKLEDVNFFFFSSGGNQELP